MISKSNREFRKQFGKFAAIAFGSVALAAWPANAAPTQAAQAASAVTSVPQSNETAQASVPRLVQFNGTLKDSAAHPVTGVASVTFAIYAEQDGGVALWSETQNVLADANGHYTVLLGSATANGVLSELFGTGQSRWLGVSIARQQELPRVLLASVPYALKAADADTLGGLPASAYVTTQSLAATNAKSAIRTFTGANTTIVATPQAASVSLAPSGIPQVTPTGSGTTDFIPMWTSSSVLGNSTIFESAGLVGIGTTTPAETLDVNGNSIFRGSFQLPPGHPATASSGYESHSFQFQASSFSSTAGVSETEAFGFRAEPLGNNTSTPSAKLDLFYGPGGGTLTDTGFSFANNGIVTFAPGQVFPGLPILTGANTFTGEQTVNTTSGDGIFATTSAATQAGVLGINTATTGGSGGVSGVSHSPDGDGVYGVNASTTGSAVGVYGLSNSSGGIGVFGSGAGAGVYGATSNAAGTAVLGVNTTGGVAGSFQGTVSVTGNVSAAGITGTSLNLPNTTSATAGVITLGGIPFVSNGGDSTTTFVGSTAGGTVVPTQGNDTGVGTDALGSLNGGQFNTAIGVFAGSNIRTASFNTFLGSGANAFSNSISNSTAVGANAEVGASNAIVLGSINGVNSATASVNVGIGTLAPRTTLDISSSATATGGTNGLGGTPSPRITLTNTAGGYTTETGIDFNTITPSTTGTYNPGARMVAFDDGNDSDILVFQANKNGAQNNGLAETMQIAANGNVYIAGNLQVNGTVSKGGGSFKIDDPIDPSGKYLSHSFVESPDMMNIYNGIATLDAHGTAVIEMPEWFSALNRDFRYQLTAIGAPGPKLYIAEKMNGNHFEIAGGKKGQEISWQVTGIRQDAWANAHRIPTEEAKPANEQGRYLHPELYGAPAEMSVSAVYNPAKSGEAQK